MSCLLQSQLESVPEQHLSCLLLTVRPCEILVVTLRLGLPFFSYAWANAQNGHHCHGKHNTTMTILWCRTELDTSDIAKPPAKLVILQLFNPKLTASSSLGQLCLNSPVVQSLYGKERFM